MYGNFGNDKRSENKKGNDTARISKFCICYQTDYFEMGVGKSIPDEASLRLLCQCLEIDNQERNIFKKFAADKQPLLLIILAVVFSPAVIGIRYCLFKTGKLEDTKFKIMIQSIGFGLFAFYFRTLKDHVAYILLFAICIGYIIYRYYLLSLERNDA